MKVRVSGVARFERIVEVDDKYQKVAEFFENTDNMDLFMGTSKAFDAMNALGEECANVCYDAMEKEFGDDMHHDVCVYTLDNKVIFEE